MFILDVLKKIFDILFPIVLVISLFVGIKENTTQESTKEEKENPSKKISDWRSRVTTVMAIFSILFLFGTILFIWIECKISWVIFAFAIPVYLKQAVEAYASVGIIRNVVTSTQKNKLSYREKVAIEVVAYIVWLWGLYNGSEKLLSMAGKYPISVASDLLLIIFYVFIFFIYIFFICALLPTFLFFVFKILKVINNSFPYKHKIKQCMTFFIGKSEEPIKIKSLLILLIDKIKEKKLFIKLFGSLVIPFAFAIDIIMSSILAILSIIRSGIGYLFLLIHLFRQTVKRILSWISELSDKRIVALSFRVAFIAALSITVILNRYQPFLKQYNESTSVLEFVASSIIIPVIFEWIYSSKQKE